MAHTLARLVYLMLRHGEQYVNKGRKYYEEKYGPRRFSAFRKRPNSSDWKSLSVPLSLHNGSFSGIFA